MLSDKIIDFYNNLSLDNIVLPDGIKAMNPYIGEHAETTQKVMKAFYEKFYKTDQSRNLILGINPGRFGAGVTGLMFTDTIRLNKNCGIKFDEFHSRELSSEFVYQMIEKYGGATKFYNNFYIGAVSPLGYLKVNQDGKAVNYNYYDSKNLEKSLLPFIEDCLHKQMDFNLKTDVCYCLGTGNNFKFINELNKRLNIFEKVIPLEHPRYILQYKRKQTDKYVQKYIEAFAMKS